MRARPEHATAPAGGRKATRRPTAALLLTAGLSGCMVGPNFTEPAAPAVTGYTAAPLKPTASARGQGGAAQHFVKGEDVAGDWWRLFHSKQIDAFVAEAVANHPDIQSAEAALREAREVAAAATSGLFPSVTADGSVTRNRVASTSGPASLYTLYNTNAPVSFTPDLFGGQRRGIEADLANADYQRFQLEATYLALTANVVTAAINDASYTDRIAATRDQIDSQRRQVDLLEQQFKLGAVSSADVLSQKAQLATSMALLPPLQKSQAQNRNQLMAYLGRLPSEDKGEAVRLADLHLASALPLTVPSQLVRQRPDIRAAEAQLHQATANVGVATANMLPSLTLSASGGSEALSVARLFDAQTTAWSAAASLSAPIFDAGALFHTKQSKMAALDQSAAQYRSTIITAFQNVADSLRAIQSDADLLKAQVTAESTAAASLTVSQEQFKAGSVTFLNVLNAEQTLLNARTNRIAAEASRFADTVALYQSLGGGWWNRADETAASTVKPARAAALLTPLGAVSGDAAKSPKNAQSPKTAN